MENEPENDETNQNENEPEQFGDEKEKPVVEKEQVYKKIKSKVEILDILFHPTENNLITLGLINGKLKM